MHSINNRIAKVFEESALTKTDFARKLNITPQFISRLILGTSNPSERTLIDIADKFCVNEEWLRTGEGPMKIERTRADEIATFMGDLLDSPPSFKQRLVSVLASLNEGQWELLEDMANKLVEEAKEKPGQRPGNGQDDQ